jgi:hypothetical protein
MGSGYEEKPSYDFREGIFPFLWERERDSDGFNYIGSQ